MLNRASSNSGIERRQSTFRRSGEGRLRACMPSLHCAHCGIAFAAPRHRVHAGIIVVASATRTHPAVVRRREATFRSLSGTEEVAADVKRVRSVHLGSPDASAGPARRPGRGRTLVVPFPPGGSTDFTARVLALKLESDTGEPVRIATVTGNAGIDAMRRLTSDDPERSFLVGNINTNSLMPVVHRDRIPFAYESAVSPVSRLAEFPSVLITQATFPADSLAEFLVRLKSGAGELRYATDFLGTYVDIDAITLARKAGLEIAYRSTEGALGILADIQAGRVDLAMLNVATATAKRGQFKALAVTGPGRLRGFPDVPTMAEAGYAGVGTSNWQGLFASSRASVPTIEAMHRAVRAAMHSPEVLARFESVDARVATSTSPREFADEIRQEMRTWEEALPAIRALRAISPSN